MSEFNDREQQLLRALPGRVSELENLSLGVLDEDDMASDSATKLATQQSIKAYVDNNAGNILEVQVFS